MELRPRNGSFLRPFGTAWFIIEFLKGHGPEDSKEIDPNIGAPMTDIHFKYKSALHRVHARDAVEVMLNGYLPRESAASSGHKLP